MIGLKLTLGRSPERQSSEAMDSETVKCMVYIDFDPNVRLA